MSSSNVVVDILIRLGCLQFSPSSPFTYSSGLTGPIYCDNRYTLGFPKERKAISDHLVQKIRDEALDFDGIAAVATAGIPYGTIMAHELQVPLVYVRSSPKRYGAKKSIEGHLKTGGTVLLVEDLVNQGKGVEGAVRALREEGGFHLRQALSIVDYEMLEAQKKMELLGVELFSLAHFSSIVARAPLSADDKEILRAWHRDPERWGAAK